MDIGITTVDIRAVSMLSWWEAEELRAIPIRLHLDDTVSFAVADPTDDSFLPSLKLALGAATCGCS